MNPRILEHFLQDLTRAPKYDAKFFLLDTLGMKDWNVCVTKDEEGNEVFMAGGRVTTDLKPGPGG